MVIPEYAVFPVVDGYFELKTHFALAVLWQPLVLGHCVHTPASDLAKEQSAAVLLPYH